MAGFFTRHKRKITGLACAIGASYGVFRYLQYKLEEFQQKAQIDQHAKENIKLRFDRNMQDCILCLISELPNLQDQLFAELPVEQITARLNQQRKLSAGLNSIETSEEAVKRQKVAKRELFDEMKSACLTRAVASLYLVNLLAALLHIQLNLVGRHVYLNSVVSESEPSHLSTRESKIEGTTTMAISPTVDRLYLSLSYFLTNVSWKVLVKDIEAIIKACFKEISLGKSLAANDWDRLFLLVRKRVEETSFSAVLLPASNREIASFIGSNAANLNESDQKELERLLNETRDLVESNDFTNVLSSLFSDSFNCLLSALKSDIYHIENLAEKQKVKEISNHSQLATLVPLAAVFPFFTRQSNLIISSISNPYLDCIQYNKSLEAFSAVIYSGYSSIN